MVHAGLPLAWVLIIAASSSVLVLRALFMHPAAMPVDEKSTRARSTFGLHRWFVNPWPQTLARLAVVALFLLVVYAGIAGTPIPERNFATVVTWNLWWSGLIVVTLFAGTAWCGVCPWDSLAQWMVRRRLWRRGDAASSLNLVVPPWLRSIWPATVMFVGLTWLELGFGITRSPYATAMLALVMVAMATVAMALYERKAFCRYLCPVGRTLGVYAQMSTIELRPMNTEICASCKTLDCYHGNAEIEPCPTRLVMGRFHQNTYCTSCGACVRSCPHQNVSWHGRAPATEIRFQSRPHNDEAWFIVVLLALTSFHGVTMMPFWEQALSQSARALNDSGRLLMTFSVYMALFMATVGLWFIVLAALTSRIATSASRPQLYARLAFTAVPLAFAYHLSHNVGHLFRESSGSAGVWLNPTGAGTLPLTAYDIQCRMQNALAVDTGIHAIQTALVVAGVYFAIEVLRNRLSDLYDSKLPVPGIRLLPMLVFIGGISSFNIWLLMNPMIMRY